MAPDSTRNIRKSASLKYNISDRKLLKAISGKMFLLQNINLYRLKCLALCAALKCLILKGTAFYRDIFCAGKLHKVSVLYIHQRLVQHRKP